MNTYRYDLTTDEAALISLALAWFERPQSEAMDALRSKLADRLCADIAAVEGAYDVGDPTGWYLPSESEAASNGEITLVG